MLEGDVWRRGERDRRGVCIIHEQERGFSPRPGESAPVAPGLRKLKYCCAHPQQPFVPDRFKEHYDLSVLWKVFIAVRASCGHCRSGSYSSASLCELRWTCTLCLGCLTWTRWSWRSLPTWMTPWFQAFLGKRTFRHCLLLPRGALAKFDPVLVFRGEFKSCSILCWRAGIFHEKREKNQASQQSVRSQRPFKSSDSFSSEFFYC